MLAVEWLIPAQRFHRYIYGIDEYGNPFDRRSIIISILALFVTYLLIRGWRAHREKPWQ